MRYLKEFSTYPYSYLKESNATGIDELDKEIETLEADISKKLRSMTDGISEYTDWTKPEFGERMRKNKDIMDSFMHRMPFYNGFGKFEDICRKMIDITNVETLAQYFADLFSFLDRIEEVSNKITKENEDSKEENGSLKALSRRYREWFQNLKELRTKVESPGFLAKIAEEKELEVAYKKKDGEGEAEGKITGFKIEDDGGVKFTVDNEKVGKVEKELGELVNKEEGEKEEADLPTKLSGLKAKDPDSISKVLRYADFISNPENKDKVSEIEKIIGT